MKGRSILYLSLVLILAGRAGVPSAQAEAATVVVGTLGEAFLSSGSLSIAPTTFVPGVALNGLVDWRQALAAGGIFSLSADSRVGLAFTEEAGLYDLEAAEARLSLLRGSQRLDFAAGLQFSLAGTLEEEPYLRPEWELRWLLERGRRQVRPFLTAYGSYLTEGGSEDVLFQGGRIGFMHRPSVRFGYELALDGGWEYWPEQFLLGAPGAATRRQDVRFGLLGEADGLLGYFLDWNLQAAAGLRLSNTRRFLPEENSENRWSAGMAGALAWSPTRRLSLQVGLSGWSERYLERLALTAAETAGRETLWVFDLGPSLRLDWTSDDRVYLVLDGSGTWRMSNDPGERGWRFRMGGGLEISF